MLSKKQLRLDIKAVANALKKRYFYFDVDQLLELEGNRKKFKLKLRICKIYAICSLRRLEKLKFLVKMLSLY